MKEIREVRSCEVMKSPEGEKENLVIYAVFDGQPVQLLKNKSDVIYGGGSGDDPGS